MRLKSKALRILFWGFGWCILAGIYTLLAMAVKHISSFILFVLLFSFCNSSKDYLQKADKAIEEKNYSYAIELINTAISKKKYLVEAYLEKAYCYTELKDDDSAIIIYSQLISFAPNNTLAFITWEYASSGNKNLMMLLLT